MKRFNLVQKDVYVIISVISCVLFCVVILANVIAYPLSLTDDELSGMEWFFFVLLPSIPVFMTSTILSVISIINYWNRLLKNIPITVKRKVWVVINLFQIIATVVGGICLINLW